jgi:hypothetical protein
MYSYFRPLWPPAKKLTQTTHSNECVFECDHWDRDRHSVVEAKAYISLENFPSKKAQHFVTPFLPPCPLQTRSIDIIWTQQPL